MFKLQKKTIFLLILVVMSAAFAIVYGGELWRISRFIDQYRLDEAVHNQSQNNPSTKFDPDAYLSPAYLNKYGLNDKAYETKDGFFAPNGNHWKTWSTETRVAAILMWTTNKNLSAIQVKDVMNAVNDYYVRNNTAEPIVNVVLASIAM